MSPAAPSADGIDIAGALAWARKQIDQMDARVLLRHVLQCPAARLVAWPEHKLAAEDWANYRGLVERRVAGEPVAYLTGTREFYGREFLVTPAVLIPRPETELLVELALAHFPARRGLRVLDLGAGSGAATAALLDAWGLPGETTLLDRSPVGLDVARDLLVDVYRHAPRTTRGDLRELPDGQWDVLLVSYALNESLATAPEAEQTKWIAAAARRLTPNGLLLLCEPLIDSAGPFMDRLRTAALGEAGLHIWAPCPHAQACPLAARRSSCHDVRNWRMPPAAQALNNRLGRNIQDLKFSFLALSPLAPPAAAPAFRLVAPVHPTKGKWEMLGCAPEGELRRYEVLKRDADEAARRQLGDLERGDRVQLDDLTRAGDAWRGRLSAATPAPSP